MLAQPCSGASMIVQVSRPSTRIETARPRLVERRHGGVAGLGDERERQRGRDQRERDQRPEDALQEKCSSSQPPTTGPVATPTPTTAPQLPSAAARSGGR